MAHRPRRAPPVSRRHHRRRPSRRHRRAHCQMDPPRPALLVPLPSLVPGFFSKNYLLWIRGMDVNQQLICMVIV